MGKGSETQTCTLETAEDIYEANISCIYGMCIVWPIGKDVRLDISSIVYHEKEDTRWTGL